MRSCYICQSRSTLALDIGIYGFSINMIYSTKYKRKTKIQEEDKKIPGTYMVPGIRSCLFNELIEYEIKQAFLVPILRQPVHQFFLAIKLADLFHRLDDRRKNFSFINVVLLF